jgi:hypothetical protein
MRNPKTGQRLKADLDSLGLVKAISQKEFPDLGC